VSKVKWENHTVLNRYGNRTVNSSSKAECTHSIIIFYSLGNFSSNYESFSHRARTPYCNRTALLYKHVQVFTIRVSISSDGRPLTKTKSCRIKIQSLVTCTFIRTLLLPAVKFLPLINCPSRMLLRHSIHMHTRKSSQFISGKLKSVELR